MLLSVWIVRGATCHELHRLTDELQETSYKSTPETSYKFTPVRVTNRPSAYSNPKSTDEVRVSEFASTER